MFCSAAFVKSLPKLSKTGVLDFSFLPVLGKHNNRVGDVGYAIQNYCESHGYGVVRELIGHGIGRVMHEEPEMPNYGKRGRGKKFQEGMVVAIEPMINMGSTRVSVFESPKR